jgi:hypothetical protein
LAVVVQEREWRIGKREKEGEERRGEEIYRSELRYQTFMHCMP